jgi:hypothetical protein
MIHCLFMSISIHMIHSLLLSGCDCNDTLHNIEYLYTTDTFSPDNYFGIVDTLDAVDYLL